MIICTVSWKGDQGDNRMTLVVGEECGEKKGGGEGGIEVIDSRREWDLYAKIRVVSTFH